MSAAAVAADPAVVSAKPTKPRETRESHPPKPEKPKSSALIARVVKNADGDNTFPEVDFSTHAIVHTALDNQFITIPRASAKNIPGMVIPDATETTTTAEDGTESTKLSAVVVDMGNIHAGAFIALNQWIEKKGVSGAASIQPSNPVTHTEIAQLSTDDWEKEFSKTLFNHGEAIIGCINFAEKNNMKGLREFGIVALSCALRGKSAHEMALAMGHNEDNFSASEVEQGRAAFPDVSKLSAKVN